MSEGSEQEGRGSWRAAVENVLSLLLALVAIVATFVVKDRFQSNCSPSSPYCKVNLGTAGIVKVPTVIAFRSKEHGTYLRAQPPSGGVPLLDEQSHALGSQWELTEENDDMHVSLRSYHGTYLSCSDDSKEGFAMAAYAGRKETYVMEVFPRKATDTGSRTSACFVCKSSGMYLSANPDGTLSQRPTMETKFVLEVRKRGRYALRASFETEHGEPAHWYLSATEPERRAELIQGPRIDEWAYFVLARGVAKGQFAIESAHGSFLLPVAGSRVGALSQDRADAQMMWGLTVGLEGTIGLQAATKGQWVWAMEDNHTVVLLPEYARFKPAAMFQPLVIGNGISLSDHLWTDLNTGFSSDDEPPAQEPRGAEGEEEGAGRGDTCGAGAGAEGVGECGDAGAGAGSGGGAPGASKDDAGKMEELQKILLLSSDW